MSHSTPPERALTLENCEAVSVRFTTQSHVIIWRHGPKHLKPPEGKRIRDLQPGDEVTWKGEPRVVERVEVYR